MNPLAYLILSNLPGENRLKNLKYFLGPGDNVIGADPRCQIVLPEKYQMLNHAVNIRVSHNFITLQALHPHLVYVEANLNRLIQHESNSDNFFPLAQNVQYLPKLNDFFYIGRIKAIIGSSNKFQLSLMNHIINRSLFKFESDQPQIKSQPLTKQSQPQTNFERQLENTKIVQEEHQEKRQFVNIFQNITLQQNHFNPAKQNIAFEFNPKQNIAMEIEHKNQQKSPFLQTQRQMEGMDRQSQRSKTQQLDQDGYQLDPTLVLEDGMYANQATINLDEPQFQYNQPQIQKSQNILQKNAQISQKLQIIEKESLKPFSQEILMNQIRRQTRASQAQNNEQQQIDFSMPDTIVDKEPEEYFQEPPKNEGMFKQVESRQEEHQSEGDQMPPTIQDDEPPSRIKPAKTMKIPLKIQERQQRLYRSDQVSLNKMFPESQSSKNIQNFDDLLGMDQKQPQVKHSNSLPVQQPVAQNQPNLSLMHVSSMGNVPKSNSGSSKKKKNQKKEQDIQKQKQKGQKKQIQLQKLVHIAGFKPTVSHKEYLKKLDLYLVDHPDNDYSILIVKQPLKVNNRLLLALINGKKIESQHWIFNKQSQIQSKLNGLHWRQIYEKRGTHQQLLKGKRFYISKRLEQLFQGVIQKLGGQKVKELTDKKRVINVVLQTEDSLDTQLYLQNRQVKKWRFLKSEAIIDCVLTAKFSLDQKYIIDIFKDQK